MAVLSYEQIKDVWIRNGGDPKAAGYAAAIALAESGGRTDAHNAKAPDDSYGLWQVNYFGDLRNSRTAAYGPATGLYDANAAARAAIGISGNGKTWRPWSVTYSNYKDPSTYLRSSAPFWQFLKGSDGGTANEQFAAAYSKSTPTTAAPDTATDDDETLININSPVGDIKLFKRSTARKTVGVACIVAGVAVGLVGVTLLAGKSVVLPSVPNPVAAVKDRRLSREIDAGERSAPDQVAQRARYRSLNNRRLAPDAAEAF